MSESRSYKVTVTSPYGTQSIEQFRHWIGKVASEAESRWGIRIKITELKDEPEEEVTFK